MTKKTLVVSAAFGMLSASGCSTASKPIADADRDGVPDEQDSFPNDPGRACPEGHWNHDADWSTECIGFTRCETGELVSSVGSDDADQRCEACPAGEFSDSTNAASCARWTVCVAGQFASAPGSATVDRMCSACAASEFSATENAERCTEWTECQAGEIVHTPGTASSDRECGTCPAGEYLEDVATESCTPYTTCVAGEFISTAGTSTTDQQCSACSPGEFSTATNAASCSVWTACVPGEFVASAGSAAMDRSCGACGPGEFNSEVNAASCTPFSACPAGFEVVTPGTTTADQVCGDIDECAQPSDPCTLDGDAGGSCSNTEGGFECSCSSGFSNSNGCVRPRSCSAWLAGDPSSADGDYPIDPDGAGGLAPFTASCDMTTEGGGWTLVLHYVHQGGSNPDLTVRASDLPLLGSAVIGDDDSGSGSWGHAGNALMTLLEGSELRFFGATGAHTRVLDFVIDDPDCLSYFRTGEATNCRGLGGGNRELAGASANLPDAANAGFADQGDLAMTEFPFYEHGLHHWGIRGQGSRWEVDDLGDASADTLHQIWLRDPPAEDCAAILSADADAADGVYEIYPSSAAGKTMAYCDMTTEGGGWTLCGNVDEVASGIVGTCVEESSAYVDDPASVQNYSFCKQLFDDVGPSGLMVHNRTPDGGSDYGFNDRVVVDWTGDPIVLGTYDNKAVSCYHLDADGTTTTDYASCQYASHSGIPWQRAMWSFTDGVANGYSGSAAQRVLLGPTYSSCADGGSWFSFGGGTNPQNDSNNWTRTLNVGDFYLR